MDKMRDDIEVLELRIEDWRDYLNWCENDEANQMRYENYRNNRDDFYARLQYMHFLVEYKDENR